MIKIEINQHGCLSVTLIQNDRPVKGRVYRRNDEPTKPGMHLGDYRGR